MDASSNLTDLPAKGDSSNNQTKKVHANDFVHTLEGEAPVDGPRDKSPANASRKEPGQQVSPEEDDEQDEDTLGDKDEGMLIDQEMLTGVKEDKAAGENGAVQTPCLLSEIGM